jgi:hypothetical protein
MGRINEIISRCKKRALPVELIPPMAVTVSLSDFLDGPGGCCAHYERYPDRTGRAGRSEFCIGVYDTCDSDGSHEER